VATLLVFFVFALQCASTLAVMRRETNSWRWPAFAFAYLLGLAWLASFATWHAVAALGGGA
jgi:ferrous iron transport protein B